MKLLLDEMYGTRLADALHAAGIDAVTTGRLRISGAPDADVFATAIAMHRAVLTENVGDFTALASEQLAAGGHHSGLVIALSSRFSRRPDGIKPLVAAIKAVADEPTDDRVIYLQPLVRSSRTSKKRTGGRH